jgi:hypothetical protein
VNQSWQYICHPELGDDQFNSSTLAPAASGRKTCGNQVVMKQHLPLVKQAELLLALHSLSLQQRHSQH